MPSSVKYLLESVNLDLKKVKSVKWGQDIEMEDKGVYFVSTASEIDSYGNVWENIPVNLNAVEHWIYKVKTIELNKVKQVTASNIVDELNRFWLPNESILYIGKAECVGGLKTRISQFYKTDLGNRKPHAGGHWIKTLTILNELYIHFTPAENAFLVEKELLKNFIDNVSIGSFDRTVELSLPIPFANLEIS